jgi:hypothetical protein
MLPCFLPCEDSNSIMHVYEHRSKFLRYTFLWLKNRGWSAINSFFVIKKKARKIIIIFLKISRGHKHATVMEIRSRDGPLSLSLSLSLYYIYIYMYIHTLFPFPIFSFNNSFFLSAQYRTTLSIYAPPPPLCLALPYAPNSNLLSCCYYGRLKTHSHQKVHNNTGQEKD